MKKRFGMYAAAWAVLLALFNVIAFVPPRWNWFAKYDASFWIGYAFVTISFLGQLTCAWAALKEQNVTKFFYKVSLISTSYAGLIITFVVGSLCMLISPLPYWIGILVCSIVLAANVLAVIKATTAIEEVQRIDEKIKTQTAFIKMLTVDAESLVVRAKSENIKAACKKVYEAVRYSDPMSNEALTSIEGDITLKFSKFSEVVVSDNSEVAVTLADEIIILLGDRNKKCRLLK